MATIINFDSESEAQTESERHWVFATEVKQLETEKAMLVRVADKQIAMFDTESGFRACDNRCPHEGYPLSQGSVSGKCILTCNWHNWKFDLEDGANLFGGDRLRTYEVQQRGPEIWLDITELPVAERRAIIQKSLHDAFNDHEYDRIAREISRLIRLGDDPCDVLRLAIVWSWRHLEFGWTHAYAGLADWLILFDENSKHAELQLVSLVEAVGHISFDVLREPEYPYTEEVFAFNEIELIAAIENEDETKALGIIRGGLRDGLHFNDFEPALTQAALAHYYDFGHSLIYLSKTAELINRLGLEVEEALLLSLLRQFIYAVREDKIPEFSGYESALKKWGKATKAGLDTATWRKAGIGKSLKATLAISDLAPEVIYQKLLTINALHLLSFDIAQQDKIKVTVSGNVGWLDFTHGLTFANAVGKQCMRFPDFWPQGLLQMACFSGRNAAFTRPEYDQTSWHSNDLEADIRKILESVFDHGQAEYIVSVHWLKLSLAVREEMRASTDKALAEILVAALNRFIASPLKRKQTRRTAYQSLQFVAKE